MNLSLVFSFKSAMKLLYRIKYASVVILSFISVVWRLTYVKLAYQAGIQLFPESEDFYHFLELNSVFQ